MRAIHRPVEVDAVLDRRHRQSEDKREGHEAQGQVVEGVGVHGPCGDEYLEAFMIKDYSNKSEGGGS